MKYVILGSSAAGINGARELRKLDATCEIVLISKDKEIYSRCILHQYLCGERTIERLNFAEQDFDKLYQVNWLKGKACIDVKPKQKQVILDDGEAISYDKLLIATGSHVFMPPVKNLKEAKNVTGFRNIEDIDKLKEAAKNAKHIIVMGAGLVGIDCVSGLLKLGVKATIVEMADWMLSKQLDKRAAKAYQEAFSNQGVRQYYSVGIAEVVLDENNQIKEAILTDGRKLVCDYLVMTAGVRSNIEFLENSDIKMGSRGLLYDETGKTSDDDVYGAGDVSGMSPIWPAAVKEGIIAASNMAGVKRKMTDFFASKSTMNFLGIPSMSLGDINLEDSEATVEIKETKGSNQLQSDQINPVYSYKKIIHKNGKILGAVLQGDLNYGGILQQLIAKKIDVSKVKKPIFDIDYSDFFHTKDNFEFYFEEEIDKA